MRDKLSIKPPSPGNSILWGWKPRACFWVLVQQSLYETFSRPIFLALTVIGLIAGVCQVSIFISVILGAQQFIDDAMTTGSRLNRVEIKPRRIDRKTETRFPVTQEIKSWDPVEAVVPRRATLAKIETVKGDVAYSATGLHPNDPEYGLLSFAAGDRFTGNHDQLEIIVTTSLLNDIYPAKDGSENSYQNYIGKSVTVKLRQFTKDGKVKNEIPVHLKIVGIIYNAEGGRQLYLPNTTHLVFDKYKMDRRNEFPLPLNNSSNSWNDMEMIKKMSSYPWEDSLQIYSKEMEGVLPIIDRVSKLGYKPRSDIWEYKWAIDLQKTAWNIFIPLLFIIISTVAVIVSSNIFTSAKLKESELALWRVLGMRRGDIVITQVFSTVISVITGTVLGIILSWVIVAQSKTYLEESSNASQNFSNTTSLSSIFAPISDFYLWILISTMFLGVIFSWYPAINVAKTDPAKVLNS